MRKALALILTAGLIGGAMVAPASAAKKKKKAKLVTHTLEDSIDVTLLPLPKRAVETEYPGCLNGVEGVHKHSHPFSAPGTGKMVLDTKGFTGDWDAYIYKGALQMGASENEQIVDQAPAEEEVIVTLKKGDKVDLIICNWAGAPQATLHYKYTWKAPASAHKH